MTNAVDPATSVMTGGLPGVLLLAALLTWPIAIGLLHLYTRAVRKSMRSSAANSTTRNADEVPEGSAPSAQSDALGRAVLYDLPEDSSGPADGTLFGQLIARPRRAAAVYVFAGAVYALIMATAHLWADGLELLPVQFSFQFWISFWPVVLTIGLIAAVTRLQRTLLAVAYFMVLSSVAAIAMPASPDLTWSEVFVSWTIFNLVPTAVMLTYLSRRVRAVGPLVLIFMTIALGGAFGSIAAANVNDRLLRGIVEVAGMVGLGGVGTFWAIQLLGFVAFAALGWLVLGWIRRQYQSKRISDESVTIDAIWILFTIANCINLVFGHPLWVLAGVGAFLAYKSCVRIGLRLVGHDSSARLRTPVLLVLRSFSIGKDGERLFDVVDRFWRRVGSIQMIAGVDLAHRTVEPHEFLDFLSGKLARRFIDGPAELDQRMRERDTSPDRDLRFRVNDFFCYDDTWKLVLSRLARESDAVLMDLRGFSKRNAGCVFELGELARMVPLERVVFVVDRRTDEQLLAETLGARRAGVYRMGSMNGRHIRDLMRSLAAAASPLGMTAR